MEDKKKLSVLQDFPPITTEQWEEVIKKDLKGGDYAKKLLWRSENGITVKPYYRREDINALQLESTPGQFPFTRGNRTKGNDWKIREEIEESDPAKANEIARKAIESGADEVCFVLESGIDGLHGVKVNTPQEMSVLLSRIPLDLVPVHICAGSGAKRAYDNLVEGLGVRALHIMGSIDYDPLGDTVLTGFSKLGKAMLFDEAADLVNAARKRTPSLKVLGVRGYQFSEAGSTTVQELGCALAQAIEYMAELTARGLSAKQLASAIFFRLAIGTNYFFEIAKFRALREVWAQVLASFGIDPQTATTTIHARTCNWNVTIYDPYVNALRGTTEAMAAAVGGVDSISVAAFDQAYEAPDEFSRRLARNTQIILKKEAYFDRAVDPAAGSYYVETLTESIAREAWKLMRDIDGCGGFLKSLEDGRVQTGINEARKAKDAAIAARRLNVLGTNQFPNGKERVLNAVQKVHAPVPPDGLPTEIRVEPLRPYRGAEVFEALRLRMERHAAATGKTPRVLLLEIGDLKMRKARSAFCANFFGCAGFEIVETRAADVNAAHSEVIQADPAIVVLCSSDAEYPEIAGPFIRTLRDGGKLVPVIVAGYPTDTVEKLRQDGVADFIHVKSNAVEVLKKWQEKVGVRD